MLAPSPAGPSPRPSLGANLTCLRGSHARRPSPLPLSRPPQPPPRERGTRLGHFPSSLCPCRLFSLFSRGGGMGRSGEEGRGDEGLCCSGRGDESQGTENAFLPAFP